MVEMKLVGFDQLLSDLREFGSKVEGELVQAALKDAAEPALEAARAMVPVESGYLQHELKIRGASRRGGRIRVFLTTRSKRPKTAAQRHRLAKAKARVRASGGRVDARRLDFAFYSHFLEFGTKKMAPKPFLRPALASAKGAFVARFEAAMREGIATLLVNRR